jgi:hypothetical protein
MNQSFVPTPIRVTQDTTGRTFTLHTATAADWAGQWPTDRIGNLLVSEAPGTADGSVFAFWLGRNTLESPGTLDSIKEHLNDHDVVGARVIFGFPDDAHSSLKSDLAAMKAAATVAPLAADHKAEAIAWADAYLSNAGLITYSDMVKAYSWMPIAEAPKDRYLLGRDAGLKRPFVMIWNVPDQAFVAAEGMGDEIPTEYMELPKV